MITNEEDALKPREPLVVNEMTPEGRVINDLTLGEYDVVVTTAPARDTFDELQFAEALSLRQAGVAIPDDAVIEYSHLTRKEELAQRIRVMTGVEPPSEQEALMQQAQTQMAMQTLQLEVAKLEAEVQKLQSEAAMNMAKAQDTQTQPQIEMAEIQGKLEMKNRELELRRELAALSNDTRQGQSQTAAAAKLAATAMNTAVKQQEYKPVPPPPPVNTF